MGGWQCKIANSLFLLLLFFYEVRCDCVLTEKQLNECIGVITLNGDLLRTTKIKKGQKLNIYPIDGETPKRNIECKDECGVSFSPEFPSVQKRDKCSKNTLLITKNLGFNSNCHGNIYSINYQIEGTLIELYRTCYDKENYVARYAEGDIYSKDGASAKRPECGFTFDEAMTGYVDSSISRGEVKKTFTILYQSKYSIGDRNSKDNLDRGHLTPANDYVTFAQKVATFKMLNVIPQFHRYQAQGGNWYEIEKYIQTLANNYQRIFVQTGTHEVLQLTNASNYLIPAYLHYNELEDKWKFPVPAWVYKLVKDNQDNPIFASITFNNPYATQIPAAPAFCKPINCATYNLRMSNQPSLGITYCCKPNEFTPIFNQPTDVSSRGLGINKPSDSIPSRRGKKRGGGGGQGTSVKRHNTG